ncbi:hypothetical protein PHLCEN_2v12859 [Hermanssonia centrifuga]|uniref:DUF6533 domain-containing protein n=1 Tax=Hermanssonia centrifuga TaxID=98765 RepID=A0A2R6NFP4_9APHY|nr:hypothetical protein PHLCEN_2v12859 [Hermanssonia centrifuga]
MSDTEHITYSVESNAVYAIVAIAGEWYHNHYVLALRIYLLALTLYDHILTLPQEIDHIWRRKVTGVTVLFVANRYITLCMIFLVFQSTWSDSVSA